MKIKNTTAAILAAAAMTAATTAWAVDAAPASVPQITENAQTGKVVAADEFGIGEGRHMFDGRGYGHRDHDRGDCGFGFGHGFGFHGGRACW